jgi:Fic family protein
MKNLNLIKTDLLPSYLEQVKILDEDFEKLQESEISTENFSFYTSVSSVFSSKIEGEEINLDSFIKHKNFGVEFQPDYTKKIDDLYYAYRFAQNSDLNKDNGLEVHKILTNPFLKENQQGVFRKNKMCVLTDEGKIEYVATSPFKVEKEMNLFFKDLKILLKEDLAVEESFYFACFLHLVFVKIHPMNDGNGRLARLIEKWFLAQKLGEKSWFLQSEKMYHQNHKTYYQNIRKLGIEYENLDDEKAFSFLLMLPKSLK